MNQKRIDSSLIREIAGRIERLGGENVSINVELTKREITELSKFYKIENSAFSHYKFSYL